MANTCVYTKWNDKMLRIRTVVPTVNRKKSELSATMCTQTHSRTLNERKLRDKLGETKKKCINFN